VPSGAGANRARNKEKAFEETASAPVVTVALSRRGGNQSGLVWSSGPAPVPPSDTQAEVTAAAAPSTCHLSRGWTNAQQRYKSPERRCSESGWFSAVDSTLLAQFPERGGPACQATGLEERPCAGCGMSC